MFSSPGSIIIFFPNVEVHNIWLINFFINFTFFCFFMVNRPISLNFCIIIHRCNFHNHLYDKGLETMSGIDVTREKKCMTSLRESISPRFQLYQLYVFSLIQTIFLDVKFILNILFELYSFCAANMEIFYKWKRQNRCAWT